MNEKSNEMNKMVFFIRKKKNTLDTLSKINLLTVKAEYLY